MLIVAVLVFVVGFLATSLAGSDLAPVGVFAVLGGLGLLLAAAGRPPEERRTLARLFALSFVLRVAAAIVIYHFGLVDVLGDEDSSGWYGGWGIAAAWKGDPQFAGVRPDFMQALHQINQGQYYLFGVFLYLLGVPSRLSLAMLSAMAGSLTVALVYRIGRRLFDRDAAERAGMWAALFPSLVVWSAQTLKEPFVLLFECSIVYAVVTLRERASFKMIVLLLGALIALYTMRFYAAYVSAAAAVLILAWPRRDHRAESLSVAAAVASAIVLGLFSLRLWSVEAERIAQFNLGAVDAWRVALATGTGSGKLLPYDVSTPRGLLSAFPASAASFLLSPYPWAVTGSLRLRLALVDVTLWYWLIPAVLAGLRAAWRMHRAAVGMLTLFIVPLTVLYSILYGNAGLAFRERAQIMVLCLIFAGLGLALKRRAALDRPRGPALQGGPA